jgi:hypothetical protein
MLVAGSNDRLGIFIVSADMVRNLGGAGWLNLRVGAHRRG